MVTGIDKFREWFRGYEEQYAIIGGAACDLLMQDEGLDFRATKDIDLVLIVEAITPELGKHFWAFIQAGGYEHRNKSTGQPQFYRFSHPNAAGFPFMIELFTRKLDGIPLLQDAVLTPLPLEEDISSLSAILLDDDYYDLLRSGTTQVDGISVLDAAYLIPFKAKAWLDLTAKKEAGEAVDSRSIRKHKNDVFRLSVLLNPNTTVRLEETVRSDFQLFLTHMEEEPVDLNAFGIRRSKEEVLQIFRDIYQIH